MKMSDMDLQRQEVVDLNFITDGTIERVIAPKTWQRRRIEDECEFFERNLHHAFNYAEAALDNCKSLARLGCPMFDRLEEVETYVRGLLLAVLLLQSQHAKVEKDQ
jgi:hypothetical protein